MECKPTLCDSCCTQKDNARPHLHLREISDIPDTSTIFLCARCNAYWELSRAKGWDLLLPPDQVSGQG